MSDNRVEEVNSVPDDSNEANGDGDEEMEQNQDEEEYDSQDEDESDASNDQEKRVRDRLAYIDIPQKEEGETMIFSYHYKYEKYLRDHHLIDPEKAKNMQERIKMRANEANDKDKKNKNQPTDGSAPKLPNLDGEDLAGDDDEASYPGAMKSKYRFDQLIKTMIARIEYNNTLAPV